MTTTEKHQHKPGSRGAVLIKMRDAILAHEAAMTEIGSGLSELAIGMFVIRYALPGSQRGQRTSSLAIWPKGATPSPYFQGNTLASFGWDERDEIVLFQYNNGEWLNELLSLLAEDAKGQRAPGR